MLGNVIFVTCSTLLHANNVTKYEHLKLTPTNSSSFQRYGYSVSIQENIMVIGNPGDDIKGLKNSGSASVYLSNGTHWKYLLKIAPNDIQNEDGFGHKLAMHRYLKIFFIVFNFSIILMKQF